jgi:hypothetical protein
MKRKQAQAARPPRQCSAGYSPCVQKSTPKSRKKTLRHPRPSHCLSPKESCLYETGTRQTATRVTETVDRIQHQNYSRAQHGLALAGSRIAAEIAPPAGRMTHWDAPDGRGRSGARVVGPQTASRPSPPRVKTLEHVKVLRGLERRSPRSVTIPLRMHRPRWTRIPRRLQRIRSPSCALARAACRTSDVCVVLKTGSETRTVVCGSPRLVAEGESSLIGRACECLFRADSCPCRT